MKAMKAAKAAEVPKRVPGDSAAEDRWETYRARKRQRLRTACSHDSGSEVMDVDVVSFSPLVQPILSAEVMDVVEAAESKAKNALESLFLECTERGQERLVDDAVAVHVKSALGSLTDIGRHMTASANALLAMGRALSAIPPTPENKELAERVTEVECKVRDVAVWRCQKSVPIDNRVKFIAKLKEAFGFAFEDKNLFSRLMHAHKNAVSEKVATAFLSNTQQACIKHGRTRGDMRTHGQPHGRKLPRRKHVGLLLEITIEEGLEELCRESGDIDQSSFSSNPQ